MLRPAPLALGSVPAAPAGGAGVGADEALLPVPAALAGLFPVGLRRGWTVAVTGSSSLLLALLAEPSRCGWCAEVGSPLLASAAAAEAGVALDRFVRVPAPGEQWPAVTAGLLEAFDVVVVHPPARVRDTDVRRLSARARERAAVLVVAGPWPGAMVELSVTEARWHGLGCGHGHLRRREVEVRASGRGAAARPRRARVWLPAAGGGLAPAADAEPAHTKLAHTGLAHTGLAHTGLAHADPAPAATVAGRPA